MSQKQRDAQCVLEVLLGDWLSLDFPELLAVLRIHLDKKISGLGFKPARGSLDFQQFCLPVQKIIKCLQGVVVSKT